MSFPTSPTNGQQVTLNYVTYQYDSTNTAWYRVSTSVSEPIGSLAYGRANSAYAQANSEPIGSIAFGRANSAYAQANTGGSTAKTVGYSLVFGA